jgi:malonate decarboxylase gamma subunit
MTLDEILKSLFPSGHDVKTSAAGIITGTGKRKNGEAIAVIGVANGVALGTAGVLPLAEEVLRVVAKGGKTPILVLVDTQGQLMARRDEMRGLNEYLAHLAKCLLLASQQGHRTIGLEYGKAADRLVGLPGAEPTVMDLPSVSRVTKLPLDTLKVLAKTTPVFAPGLDHLLQVGAVAEVWDPEKPLLGATVRRRWGSAILRGPIPLHSHGTDALRRFGGGCARAEGARRLSPRTRRRAVCAAAWPRAGTWRSGGRSRPELPRASGFNGRHQSAPSRRRRRPASRPGASRRVP